MEDNTSFELAEKAFALCREAYRAKDISQARIYALNAITHHSSLKYLEAYLSIIKKMELMERRVAIEQAVNIYSMAMYQCDPADVEKIQDLLCQLEAIQDDCYVTDAWSDDSSVDTPVSNGELIDQYSWKTLKKKGTINSLECIREKTTLFQKLIDSGILSTARRQQCEKEFQESISLQDYLTKIGILENTIWEARKELESPNCNVYYVAARLQNAATLLSQLWLVDVSNIIPESKKQLNAFALNIEETEKKYNKFRSAPLFRELKTRLLDAIAKRDNNGMKLTPVLNYWQQISHEISPRLCELADSESVMELQKLLNQLNSTAETVAKKRFALYQKFCADKCYSAIKSFDETVGRVSETDSVKYLDRWDIAKIDESLLSPEASGIFQTAKGMLLDKLSRVSKAEFQVKCVVSEKFKLEDF